jgi:hypothetical protein
MTTLCSHHQIQAVRARIIEANADIVRVHHRVIKKKVRTVKVTRQIRLADVFIAIDRFGRFKHARAPKLKDGVVTQEWKDAANASFNDVIMILSVITSWNKWEDSLDDQDDACLSLLASLLLP